MKTPWRTLRLVLAHPYSWYIIPFCVGTGIGCLANSDYGLAVIFFAEGTVLTWLWRAESARQEGLD